MPLGANFDGEASARADLPCMISLLSSGGSLLSRSCATLATTAESANRAGGVDVDGGCSRRRAHAKLFNAFASAWPSYGCQQSDFRSCLRRHQQEWMLTRWRTCKMDPDVRSWRKFRDIVLEMVPV